MIELAHLNDLDTRQIDVIDETWMSFADPKARKINGCHLLCFFCLYITLADPDSTARVYWGVVNPQLLGR